MITNSFAFLDLLLFNTTEAMFAQEHVETIKIKIALKPTTL